MATPIIDSHQHFWHPEQGEYPWMTGAFDPIKQPYSPQDLAPLLKQSGVDGTIVVQTWSSLEETYTFLKLAKRTPFIKGIVGWVDLTANNVDTVLNRLKLSEGGEYLVGIRHQVHDEEDPNWLLRADVCRGLTYVEKHDLVYDLLVRPRELHATIATVQRFPNLRFVIDHIAKPNIANQVTHPWLEDMQALGEYKNHVWCKLSGMTTEANWTNWRAEDIEPYIHYVLKIFGASRCMYGSDWPVCTVAGSYLSTKRLLDSATTKLSSKDKEHIWGASAIEAYRLRH